MLPILQNASHAIRLGPFVLTPVRHIWLQALLLSLGAAVSLGITRFAYGLLLGLTLLFRFWLD